MKKQSLLKGTVILGLAGITAKFLGLFFRWPLVMLIGDEGIGYYQMTYPLYLFFISIASGVPVAISKMVSERNAVGDREGTIQVLRKAILFLLIMGTCFSAIMLFFAKDIIHIFRWDSKSYYAMVGIALAPIFISIMTAFRGFFQGMQNMEPTAISQLLEQLGRVVIGVGLAYILRPKGIEFSAGGAAFGAAAGGILGGIYLVSKYMSVRKEFNIRKVKNDTDIMTKLLYISIPISLGAVVGTVMSVIDSILVPQKLLQAGFNSTQATILYGRLTGKAYVFTNVPLTLSMALCISLVPIITECYALNKRFELVRKVEAAMKISFVIAIPCFFGLYFMSAPILQLVFPGHADGYLILKYLSISVPFVILAQTTTAILQGVGRYVIPVINLFIGCIVKICLTYTLVAMPSINIYGAIIGTVVAYIIAAILDLIAMKRILKISINYYNVMIKPAFASAFMILGVVFLYMYVYNSTKSNSLSCLISMAVGVVIYSLSILIFGVFRYNTIKKKLFKRG